MKIQKLTLSAIASLALLNSFANAKPIELDPVVISSDFRSSKLSKTNNSVTVLSYSKIADKASDSFENVVGQVPNVNFTAGASRAHFVQIRGIGERSQFERPINPAVGLIVDGIDVSDSALALTMFDLKQIEVLKGPQGTTFGSNGMAGVISLQNNEPTEETEGHIEATVGNYNKKALGFAVGGSVIEDTLLARISAYQNTSDGFMKNKHLGKEDTQNIDELTAKAHLRLLASDVHTIDLNILHVNVDNGYDAFTFDNSRNTLSDQPGTDAQETNAFALKSTYQLNNKMHLESKTSFSKTNSTYSFDEDWTFETYHPNGFTSFDEYIRKKKNVDLDLRLISDEDGKILNGSTNWTIGAYIKDSKEDLVRNKTGDSQYKSTFDSRKTALYGQLDSALNDKLTLITGLRVEKWEADFLDSDNFKVDTDENLIGGKIGLSYEEDENNLYYATISKGYKPGGVNVDNKLSFNARTFETEHLWNLDIGKNFSNFENKLKTRINFFYGLRRDQQVNSSLVIPKGDGSTDFIGYIANAAKSNYYGLELQTNYYPNDNLHLFGSLGLLKSEFDEYTDPNPKSLDVNGRAPAQSPKYQYNVGFSYMLSNTIQFKTDVEGKDSYFFSNRHNEKAKSYRLLNTSVSYLGDNWTATLWGKNLTDEKYETRGFGTFGNNPANGWKTEKYTQQGDPRTFGITVGYTF